MTTVTEITTFNRGSKIEFYNDGDVCEVIRGYSLKGLYWIEYKSIKTSKKYTSSRRDLLKLILNNELTIKYPCNDSQ